jgi:protein associated with RNAse G/E
MTNEQSKKGFNRITVLDFKEFLLTRFKEDNEGYQEYYEFYLDIKQFGLKTAKLLNTDTYRQAKADMMEYYETGM